MWLQFPGVFLNAVSWGLAHGLQLSTASVRCGFVLAVMEKLQLLSDTFSICEKILSSLLPASLIFAATCYLLFNLGAILMLGW